MLQFLAGISSTKYTIQRVADIQNLHRKLYSVLQCIVNTIHKNIPPIFVYKNTTVENVQFYSTKMFLYTTAIMNAAS